MASLFTDQEKSAVEAMFDDIHDTFERTVSLFIEEAQPGPLPTNFDPIYGRSFGENRSSVHRTPSDPGPSAGREPKG